MKTSFDEIRKIAFRALDSAGAPPGIDDDGGWACAWLEAAGYPGLRMLADFLDGDSGQDKFSGVDSIADGQIDAAGRSAITLAGLVAEFSATQPDAITVKQLRHAPYLIAHAARLSDKGVLLVIDPVRQTVGDVTIRHGGDGYANQSEQVRHAVHHGLEAEDEPYHRVYAYSRAILVPQSETSLLSGAGAGLTDND